VHDCLVVLGGPHVSVLPEESCGKPYVDVVVRGKEKKPGSTSPTAWRPT
jgi:hypothetical protein